MAVFKTIGNAFKNGWNQGSRNFSESVEYVYTTKAEDRYKEIPSNPASWKNVNNYSQYYVDALQSKNNSIFGFKYTDDSLLKNSNDKIKFETTGPWDIIAKNTNQKIYYENGFKLPLEILTDATKNYKFIYNKVAHLLGDVGFVKEDGKEIKMGEVIDLPVVPSMFNPLYGLNIVGITPNTPLFMSKKDSTFGMADFQIHTHSNYSKDLSDCSIKTLVEESKKGNLGRGVFKYSDFMYCKNLGKISNNRLITLRRFPVPIGDDIWNINAKGGPNISGDIGRLVTWMDDTNKLEDILKYNYSDSFVKRESKFQDKESRADSEDGGILGAAVNLANPKYRNAVGDSGNAIAGGGNMILNAIVGKEYTVGRNQSDGENREVLFGRYDENRVYEPKGTIRETHLYEGKLSFNHEFSLTFDYELRAYENINPKTAFLDLLTNIQQVTYRKGNFWGGQVWWKGAPENTKGWETANAFIDKTWDKLTDTIEMLAAGELNLPDWLGNIFKSGQAAIQSTANTMGNIFNNPTDYLNKAVEFAKKTNIGNMLKGMIKNRLGRPALYATNSILTGDPVGLWHITIGNPRNPILAMGNLIIDNASIQHYGPLGLDDFPTGLKVTVNLKHAKPRDMTEIGKMYTMGTVGLGVPLARTDWNDLLSNGKTSLGTVDAENDKGEKIQKEIFSIDSPYAIKEDSKYVPYTSNQLSTMWASTEPTNGSNEKKSLEEAKKNNISTNKSASK